MLTDKERTNLLLAAMAPHDFAVLTAGCIVIDMVQGEDLALAGQPMRYCWFPLTGMASLIAADADGYQAEVGLVGFDGMINSSVALGSTVSAMRILVQIGGTAVRIDARQLLVAIHRSVELQKQVLTYIDALAIQVGFSALAYAQYPIPKRLARWLLMCTDHLEGQFVDLTHEALSIMLGVRRAGITVAVQNLVRTGAITARRGRMTVVDRTLLVEICGSSYHPPKQVSSHRPVPVEQLRFAGSFA